MDSTEEAVRFPARVVVGGGGGGGGRDGEEAAIFTFQGEAESGVRAKQESGRWTRQLGALPRYSRRDLSTASTAVVGFGTFHARVRLGSLSCGGWVR